MRPINVLDLRDTYEIGGPGKTILETYRAIDSARFRLHLGVFLTRQEADETPFIMAARRYGVPVHVLRGFNQYDPRMVWGLVELVKRLDIDIVHAHEVKSDVITYLASKVYRVATMTTLHGWFGHSRRHRFFIGLDRLVARGFDGVVAVSRQIQDDILAAGVPADRVRLLHNAIVVGSYQRTGRGGFLAGLLGRDVPHPVIASIGRISPEKGHLDLVEGLALAAAQGCRVTAVLAGDGPSRSAVQNRIQALNLGQCIHLPGYVSEPQRLLEETDLMVLPSHTEGLPNAVLEAFAMEVPVLATRVGGTPEVITDGVTGRLVPPHAPDALAAAIADFVSNPIQWSEMAQRGRRMVEIQFDFRVRTRRLEVIYTELVEGEAR